MSISYSTKSLLPFLVALSVLVCLGQAFIIPSTSCSTTQQRYDQQAVSTFNVSPREDHSVSLSAKKRRRRRKNSDKTSPSNGQQESLESSSVPQPELEDSNELPDFDLDDGEAEDKPRRSLNPEEITANMMATPNTLARTLDEIILDRDLESKMEFEQGDPSIPDFVDLAQASSTTPSYSPEIPGKKKQRQAQRVARAIAAKEADQPDETFVSKFFPQLLTEQGKFSWTYFLESGAWIGIYTLIGWEVYINSPLFERAAPLAPVVFEIVM